MTISLIKILFLTTQSTYHKKTQKVNAQIMIEYNFSKNLSANMMMMMMTKKNYHKKKSCVDVILNYY